MSKFSKLQKIIEKKSGYTPEQAAGAAANIGRAKLGKQAFQHKAELGKEKARKK